MSLNPTNIEWATHTWNPIVGCTPASAGCANCYAELLHNQRHKAFLDGKMSHECYSQSFSHLRFLPERLNDITPRQKPKRIFVCSMGDLFHEKIPHAQIAMVLRRMSECPQHTFYILTKRGRNMNQLLMAGKMGLIDFPALADNIWAGTSACGIDGKTADDCPFYNNPNLHTKNTFVSLEPLIAPVHPSGGTWGHSSLGQGLHHGKIKWIVAGGESGPNYRPDKIEWYESILAQCRAAGVPVFFKKMAGSKPFPKHLQIREYPEGMIK